MYVCMHACMCVYVYVYTYIYIYIYIDGISTILFIYIFILFSNIHRWYMHTIHSHLPTEAALINRKTLNRWTGCMRTDHKNRSPLRCPVPLDFYYYYYYY